MMALILRMTFLCIKMASITKRNTMMLLLLVFRWFHFCRYFFSITVFEFKA